MHILLIHQAFASLAEPGGTRHYEFGKLLAEKGHQVSIIASAVSYLTGKPEQLPKFEEQVDGRLRIYRVYTFPSLHKSFFHRLISFFSFMISSFAKSLTIRKVDLVWGTSPPIFQSFTAWLVSKYFRKPYMLEIRDLWPAFAIAVGVLKNPLLINMSVWLEKFLYRNAHTIIVNSPGFIKHISDNGGKQIQFIPNGSDILLFGTPLDTKETRKTLGWSEYFIALYTGAHGISNDLDVLLEAVHHLRDYPEIKLVLAGDGKEKANLVMKANDRKLNNVVFMDPLPKNDTPRLIQSADVCIAILKPIEWYKTTYPNKVFDYMAAGKPVILAIDGVIREVVESAGCGVFSEPGDAAAMARHILDFYQNRKMIQKMGKMGQDYLKTHFERQKIAVKLAEVIEEIGITYG